MNNRTLSESAAISCTKTVAMTEYENLVKQAMIGAKEMQDFLWDRQSGVLKPFDQAMWVEMFQKRVDKIAAIDCEHRHWKVEVRKRLLQQAALSLQAILALRDINEA